MKKLIIGLLTINLACAQSLTSLYHQSLKNDPQYQSAYYQYLADLKTPTIAKSARLPQITAKAAAFRDKYKFYDDVPHFETSPGYSLQLDLKQVLFSKTLNKTIDQADLQAQLAKTQWHIQQQSLMVRTAEKYMNLLKAVEAEISAKSKKKSLKQLLNSVQHHRDLKTATKAEYLIVKAQLQQATAQALDAHYQVTLAKEEVVALSGDVTTPVYGLSDQFKLQLPKPNDVGSWEQLAFQNNLNIAAAQYQEQMAKTNIKQIKGGHFPTFYLGGQYMRQHFSSEFWVLNSDLEQNYWQIGIGMELPIYQGGQVMGKTDQAKSMLQSIQEQHKYVRRQVKKAVHQSFYGIVVGKESIGALKTAFTANEQAYQAMKQSYNLGVKTLSDYLKQTHDLYNSQTQFRQAQYDYLLATLKLKQAVGMLNEQDIEDINKLLTRKLRFDLN
jgi:outer membrane protein